MSRTFYGTGDVFDRTRNLLAFCAAIVLSLMLLSVATCGGI